MNHLPSDVRAMPVAFPSELEQLRHQIAISRALIDALDSSLPPFAVVRPPSREMVEELARLGCRTLEAAAAITGHYRALRPSTRSKGIDGCTEQPPSGDVREIARDEGDE